VGKCADGASSLHNLVFSLASYVEIIHYVEDIHFFGFTCFYLIEFSNIQIARDVKHTNTAS